MKWLRRNRPVDVDCVDLVAVITDYLDDALEPDVRAAIDHHLGLCEGCRAALSQFRLTIAATGRLADHDVHRVDAHTRADLVAAFRAAHPATD